MRLPRTLRLSVSLIRRDEGPEVDSTVVDISGLSVASILAITILVIASLTTLLITGYCVLSRRYAVRIAAASGSSPCSRRTPTAEEEKAGRGIGEEENGEGAKEKQGKEGTTVVFRQHEPGAHGYFAPLYFEGGRGEGPALGDVKREVSRVFEPTMLEGVMELEKGEKQGSLGY